MPRNVGIWIDHAKAAITQGVEPSALKATPGISSNQG